MSQRPLILVLDHNQRNLTLLKQFLDEQAFDILAISTLEDFESVLDHVHHFALALIDISGFDRRIWIICEKFSAEGVPLLVISPQQMRYLQQQSLAHGAKGVLFKPLSMPELITVIKNLMRPIKDD